MPIPNVRSAYKGQRQGRGAERDRTQKLDDLFGF